ncbi:MAG: F0F1 ATP synthase subunit B [Bacteroidetes bacterium]|nr:F0F1 ATP synthase subunit B [Bacteroidota bacterium]MDA0874421.1 F0F1 ATP synthase subunit B [Bacteroidota bacterium]
MTVFAASLLSPDAGLIVWIAITFGLLLVLLRKFAWGPITSALTQREATIAESIAQAEKALAEAKQLQADNTKARREAEAQAQAILREAREEAERLRGEEVDKTRTQIQQMQDSAQAEIEREKQSALDSLRAEVADLAVQAAEKILRANLDADRQKKIVNDFLGDLSKN